MREDLERLYGDLQAAGYLTRPGYGIRLGVYLNDGARGPMEWSILPGPVPGLVTLRRVLDDATTTTATAIGDVLRVIEGEEVRIAKTLWPDHPEYWVTSVGPQPAPA